MNSPSRLSDVVSFYGPAAADELVRAQEHQEPVQPSEAQVQEVQEMVIAEVKHVYDHSYGLPCTD